MLIPETTRITIEPGIHQSGAVHKRQYILQLVTRDETRAVITLKSDDYVPSGYLLGGASQLLLECVEIAIPKTKNMTAKKWLAKLAMKHDPQLPGMTGDVVRNRCLNIIYDKLAQMAK